MNVDELHPSDQNAVWYGKELATRSDWQQHLSDEEVDECLNVGGDLVADLSAKDLCTSFEDRLPKLASRLREIQNSLETGSGAALITGFPLESLDERSAQRLYECSMARLGVPVSQAIDGRTTFHVRDEGYAATDPRARGPSSKNRLTFHSDRCDVISFLCLRAALRGGENQIVSSVAIYQRLARERPDLLAVLKEPFWYQRHNVDPGNENTFYQQPVFSIFEKRFASSLLRVLIDRAYHADQTPAMTAQQRDALDLVESISSDPMMHYEFRQRSGDILLLNNFVTLHRRKAFEDDKDAAKRRHLLRIWLAMPNSRPLDPQFCASYGQTAAGSVRGGMKPNRIN